MRLVDYERLLPGGDDLVRLQAVVRNYVGDEMSWDANLVLAGTEVPRITLGCQGRLGWTTWLGTPDIRSGMVGDCVIPIDMAAVR